MKGGCDRTYTVFFWIEQSYLTTYFMSRELNATLQSSKKLKENIKDLAQQRVDFILRSNHDESNYLTLEEKPTDDVAKYDYKKEKQMQRNMLTLWSKWLNSNVLVSELEAVTCQWEQRKLLYFELACYHLGNLLHRRNALLIYHPFLAVYSSSLLTPNSYFC